MPSSLPPLERTVCDSLARLLAGERALLLAVSGGADSVCLLAAGALCAPQLGLRLEVAWVDHGLRPEAAEEGALVARLAGERGLPFHARALGLAPGPGLEARARVAREAALEEVRAARGLAAIATGHTASDQAETLLMRLTRGSSLKGAAGILPRKGRFLRPLLGLTRAQVEAWLVQQGLPWAEDAMNRDASFLRVRMRQRVLPVLEAAAGPGVAERLARFAAVAGEDAGYLEERAAEARARLTLPGGGLDAVGVRALPRPLQRRVLAALLAAHGVEVDAEGLEASLRAVARGGRREVGGGWRLETAGGQVRLVPRAAPAPSQATLVLARPGEEGQWGHTGWRLGWSALPPRAPLQAALQGPVSAPLLVRTRRPGDRVGVPGGKGRALQDVLVDARVPREARDALPLVVDAEGWVRWVPGVPLREGAGESAGWLWALPPECAR